MAAVAALVAVANRARCSAILDVSIGMVGSFYYCFYLILCVYGLGRLEGQFWVASRMNAIGALMGRGVQGESNT